MRVENPGRRYDGEPKGFRSDDPLQDGVELRHIFLAPHARRPELELRNHVGDSGRRAQGVQERWTSLRFASHVIVTLLEKGLGIGDEALKSVHRPPPSTSARQSPSRTCARFRTPSPSPGPPPRGAALPGGNPPSPKRRFRQPRSPGASLVSARVLLVESARPPSPRSPVPPLPNPLSLRDRSRGPPVSARIVASGRRPPLRRSSGSRGRSRPCRLGRGPRGRAQSRGVRTRSASRATGPD